MNHSKNPATGMRVVRTRSIAVSPTERLQADLLYIHGRVHTPEGLHAWDAPRRALVEYGMKSKAIAAELDKRDSLPDLGCQFCTPTVTA